MSEIDYSALGRAKERLREALAEHQRDPGNDFVRDAVIQRFEFTFELAAVSLRRFLMQYRVRMGDTSEMTFPTLIRVASEHGLLLHGWDRWYDYRKARNITSHAYDEPRAKLVVEAAAQFQEDVDFLYEHLVEASR